MIEWTHTSDTLAATEMAAPTAVDRIQRRALLVGVVFSAASIIGLFLEREQFLRSYLLAYMFWLGLSMGSLALLLMQYLTKGNWGFLIRRQIEAATRLLPMMAALFIPIALGMKILYPWARRDQLSPEDLAQMKIQHYLRADLFVMRAVIYFLMWILMAWLLNRWGLRQDVEDEPDLVRSRRYQKLSGPGMVIYGITISLAVVDWVMSIDPHWYSTIYGLIFMDGQGLSAMCFCIILTTLLMRYRPVSDVVSKNNIHDLGKLTLAMVMLWAYLSFSQFVIIWSGNLPEEIEWFMNRVAGGWGVIAIGLVLFHFAVPFSALLSRPLKRHPGRLVWVAAILIFMRYTDLLWYIVPNFADRRAHFHYSWLDAVVPIAMGGLWLAAFCGQLKRRPLFPVYDPLWTEVAREHEQDGH
jgi:hypothetical protein